MKTIFYVLATDFMFNLKEGFVVIILLYSVVLLLALHTKPSPVKA
jgi:hypothetical protein